MGENTKQDAETGTRENQSQYELTLAEFPLFLLSKGRTGNTQAIKCIEYHDTIRGKDGVRVPREWRVYPDSKYGFGTVSTFDTFFDLFQIWKEDSFKHQYIRFQTVNQLLKRRGLRHSGVNQRRVVKDLRCLTGVTIDAKNAYWDNHAKAYVDETFHLFEYIRLYKKEPARTAEIPYGSIKAGDKFYASVRKNSMLLADFDPEFFHSLTPLEKRLALYLTKVFRSQTEHKRYMLQLARQMPIYAKRTDHLRESLKRACSGLMKKGFKLLKDVTFEKNGHGEMIVFKRKGRPKGRPPQRTERAAKVKACRESAEVQLLVEDILDVCKDKKSEGFYRTVAMLMPDVTIYRALAEVREVRNLEGMRKSEGALFTSLIRKYAREQGVNLS